MSGIEEESRVPSSRQRKKNKLYDNDSFVYPSFSPRRTPKGGSTASTPTHHSPSPVRRTKSPTPPHAKLPTTRVKSPIPRAKSPPPPPPRKSSPPSRARSPPPRSRSPLPSTALHGAPKQVRLAPKARREVELSPPPVETKKKRPLPKLHIQRNYDYSGLSALVRDKELGARLRNLLKLPKAHKWVCYEWFYSDLDRCIFEGENDFQVCLRESFPQLKTTRLARIEWCKIRRLLGRPRRCSESFFREEREELQRKRMRVRLVQQRKITDVTSIAKEVPDVIPLPAVIGTKVTARLRYPQDGIFIGRVEAFDTSNNTYRISFQRPGLGTRSVPDFEVLADEPIETVSISELITRSRHRPVVSTMVISPIRCPPTPLFSVTPLGSPDLTNDVSFASESQKPLKLLLQDGSLGNFPVTLLSKMVKLSKILNRKRALLRLINSMNTETERRKSANQTIGKEFQKKYAKNIIDLDELNKHLQELDSEVQQMLTDICPEVGLDPPMGPEALKAVCYSDAKGIVSIQKESRQGIRAPISNSMLELITGLTSIMLQVKCLAEGERNANEFIALTETVSEIKSSLHPQNVGVFRDSVETHLELIQSGLSQLGNLHAFMDAKQVKHVV